MKHYYTFFSRSLFCFFALALSYFGVGSDTQAQTIDIGIKENGSTIEVYAKPNGGDFSGNLTDLTFSIRWPINTFDITPQTVNFGLSHDASQTSGSYNYKKIYFGASPQAINWTDGVEVLLISFSYSRGVNTACGCQFELAPNGDSWATANSGEYYIEVDATSQTGVFDAASTGDLLAAPSLSVQDVQDVTCNGEADGSITLLGSGGNSPYTYSFDGGSNFQAEATKSSLTANNYSVAIKGAYGCIYLQAAPVTVSQPAAISIDNATKTDISGCSLTDGTISVTASGGEGTLTYQLSGTESRPYQASGDFSNLAAGNYTVTVKDGANDCTVSTNLEVGSPASVVIDDVSKTNVTCNSADDGTITITASGGATPYEYKLTTAVPLYDYQSSNSFTGLPADNYLVYVKDAGGCVVSYASPVTITQPDAIQLSAAPTDVTTCYGESTGSIIITASGGAGGLQYSLDGSNYDGVSNRTDLPANTYTVYVKDLNDCVNTQGNVVVNQPSQLLIAKDASNSRDIKCYGDQNGRLDVIVSGGSPDYSYSWDYESSTDTMLTELPEGTYTLTVTDSKSCTAELTMSLNNPNSMSVSYQKKDVSCYNANDGEISLNPQGGTPPYIYDWELRTLSGQHIKNLLPDDYYVIVNDQNGCSDNLTITITEPSEMKITHNYTDETYAGKYDGSIDITVSGGIYPYTFSWDNGETSEDIEGLEGDEFYTVTVTDSNTCEVKKIISIGVENEEVNFPSAFTPNGDGKNDTWEILGILEHRTATLQIFDTRGRLVYEDKDGIIEPWDGTDSNGTPLPDHDLYYYIVKYNEKANPITGSVLIIR